MDRAAPLRLCKPRSAAARSSTQCAHHFFFVSCSRIRKNAAENAVTGFARIRPQFTQLTPRDECRFREGDRLQFAATVPLASAQTALQLRQHFNKTQREHTS